jgi:hypothetical protein
VKLVHLVAFIVKKSVTMHGHMNVKFVNAKQAKETYQLETPKQNCTKPTRQYGITKYAEQNSIHPTTFPSK